MQGIIYLPLPFLTEEALIHEPPYLSDFQVMKIKTVFQDDGINKRTITLEDQKQLILEGKEIEEIDLGISLK